MKVALLVSSEGWGGGEAAAISLACGLVRGGDDVTVIGRPGGLFEQCVRAAALTFEPGCPDDGLDLMGLAALVQQLRRLRPDVVHAHLNRAALWGSLASRALGLPCVATAHGMTRASYYRLTHRVIAVSQAVKGHLGTQAPGLAIEVIPNPLDESGTPDAARAAALRRELAPLPSDRLLLVAAKLHPNKGQRLALDVLARLPGCRLALAGDGPDRAALTARARELAIDSRVVFLGHRPDVRNLMFAADAVLVPSGSEAFSLVAAEALLAGVPVIARRTGGLPEVVGDDGVLVDSADAGAWVAAISAVLADLDSARARAAAAGPRLRARCDPSVVVARTREVYAQLLASRGR